MKPLQLPQAFDENEWFVIIAIIIAYSVIFWLPKRFPLSLTILLLLFGSTVARIYDHLLSSPDLHLYHIMDTSHYELFDVIAYLLYGPFSYIYIYLYERLNIQGFWILVYIVTFSLFGTMFEGLTVLFDVFNYHGWELTYSFTVYLMVQSTFILIFYRPIKRFYRLQSTTK
ncbi:hypothetical protein [Lentibacillus daqui]|uniref:hypothetical protein n=1 Tax=Lentibacillus daqui TaxID=2911514 RepID=UPI0022B109CE|nr:hypothetical protein [Lentibacillus daqui]